MSVEVVEKSIRIADVDVDESMKENVVHGEISGDSGVEVSDTGSGSYPTSPQKPSSEHLGSSGNNSDNNPPKPNSDSYSSQRSGSPLPSDSQLKNDNIIDIISTETEALICKTNESEPNQIVDKAYIEVGKNGKENNVENSRNDTCNGDVDTTNPVTVTSLENIGASKHDNTKETEDGASNDDLQDFVVEHNNLPNKHDESSTQLDNAIHTAQTDVPASVKAVTNSDDDISKGADHLTETDFNIASKSLTMSTTSLNDQVSTNSINNSKSPYSRSAEDISTLDTAPSSSESSKTDLNTEQILSEFSNQNIKVKATQKIVNDTPNLSHNIDLRYARIPKELLSQDLGSIAKSVHGIFSSVSGSLKNAYNHSQRAKPPIKTMRPVNGKVITEIFEDNIPETTSDVIDNMTERDNAHLNVEECKEVIEDESKKDLMKLQIESLERVLAEQRRENSSLRERVKQQVDELQAKDQAFKELETKVDLMCKRAEQAQKEKDAAVMRYASVECAAIEAKRAAEAATNREKAAVAETSLLNSKLRSARDEKERVAQMYDDKCHELKTSEAEVAKLREELRELDGRLKWTQSKLRVEMDAYKESSERAEKLSQQVSELEAARDTAAANATDSAKAKHFEAELKESQAALILCRHEKEELERRCSLVSAQLDTCKRERDSANEALATANAQVERLKESNLRLEEEAAELAALRAQAALADTLSSQLQRETERAARAEEALTEQMARAETCLRREAAALEHAARLTAQHVAARANCADKDAKAQALAADNASLRERITSLEEECNKLRTALDDETERRNKENRVLARKVAELTEEAAEANKQLEWEKGENSVLKKKHASAIKELNRELQRAMKRVEQLEAKLPTPTAGDATSTRTGSITSLSSGESAHDDRLHNGHADSLPDVQTGPLPERQALIERIVALQRAAARRAERCEFLEEHAKHLTEELRGKTKLLRHLLPTLPAGALASNHSDAHKKEIARLGGGAMAALWGGEAAGMTPELAIEVSARLQAVLEDTLLKNITLKENIDTLGEEIARLRKQANSSNDPK